MKKLMITCALITSASMVSFAQNQTAPSSAAQAANQRPNMPTPEQMAERHSKMYQQRYGLTDEQYKGIYAVELNFMKQEQQFRASGVQPGPGQHMQMMMAHDQKFKQIMTPDQYTKYEATQPKMNPNGTAQ